MEVKYYVCKHCGNIIEKVKDKGVPVMCCGEAMQELKAGVTDAAGHLQKTVKSWTGAGSRFLPLRWRACRRSICILQPAWIMGNRLDM